MKTVSVRDLLALKANVAVDAELAIRSIKSSADKRGKPYFVLTLGDASGCIEAKWWDQDEARQPHLHAMRYVRVQGRIDLYNSCSSIHIDSIADIGTPANLADFEPAAALPLHNLTRRLDAHIAAVRNTHLAALLRSIFGDANLRDAFDTAPAAQSNHHACRHGLLQHTVEVADTAAAIVDAQATWGYACPIERDMVVAGALLHDIGKLQELSWDDGCFAYTACGSLLGHTLLGTNKVAFKIAKIAGFPPILRDTLLHIIASHHGKLEWGAPVTPMLPEAQIVHTADLLSAQLFYMQEAAAAAAAVTVFVRKMDKQRLFVRSAPLAPADTVIDDMPVPAFVPARAPLPVRRFAVSAAEAMPAFTTRRLPLLGRVAAGPPLLAEQHIDDFFDVEEDGLPTDPLLFLLRVEGDSMTGDGIVSGDLVVVRPRDHHAPDDIVVVLLRGSDEAAIKRVQVRGSEVFLLSSNPDFAPIAVADPADLQVRGLVVARLRA